MNQVLSYEREMAPLRTIGDVVRWCASVMTEAGVYFGHGTDNAWDEATFLVLSAVHQPLDGSDQLLHLRLTAREKTRIAGWLEQRVSQRLPLPYITGEAWFAGRPYRVTPDVLVPRSPFAELLDAAFEPWLVVSPQHILDMCTGSGCIGIEAALRFPDARVTLVDISSEALTVAADNISRHGVADRVNSVCSDGFANLAGEQFDLILANPPYVDAEDLADMPAEYRHEPVLALGSGDDGLDLTRRLLAEAPAYLTEDGLMFTEVGNSAGAVEAAFPDLPVTWVELEQGGHGIFMVSHSDLASASQA